MIYGSMSNGGIQTHSSWYLFNFLTVNVTDEDGVSFETALLRLEVPGLTPPPPSPQACLFKFLLASLSTYSFVFVCKHSSFGGEGWFTLQGYVVVVYTFLIHIFSCLYPSIFLFAAKWYNFDHFLSFDWNVFNSCSTCLKIFYYKTC